MSQDLWGRVDIAQWKATPVVSGRIATEEDVRCGMAVFCSPDNPEAAPYPVKLPAPALIREEGVAQAEPVIVIQVESLGKDVVAVGYRFIAGGNGVCTLPECEFLEEPDDRFA